MQIPYCFKFGAYQIPDRFIAENGYDSAPNQRQDVEPWTDATGVTHRNPVPHTKTEITLSIRSLSWDDFTSLVQGLSSNYTNSSERDAICSYLDLETMQLKNGHFYLDPSCRFKVRRLNSKVDAFTLKFTEY